MENNIKLNGNIPFNPYLRSFSVAQRNLSKVISEDPAMKKRFRPKSFQRRYDAA